MAYMTRLGLWNNANFASFEEFNKRYLVIALDTISSSFH